jgi:crotonobetainyl-CoA:carnitine CoA-transferase CaiB-like acyl-CoA transferase
MSGPLAGSRVLELSQIIAGPLVGELLSDLCPEVEKVEPLEGEARRSAAGIISQHEG